MGEQQEIETLINKEALLPPMFLRNERESWKPRIARYKVKEALSGNARKSVLDWIWENIEKDIFRRNARCGDSHILNYCIFLFYA
jgi:hypothetical protein